MKRALREVDVIVKFWEVAEIGGLSTLNSDVKGVVKVGKKRDKAQNPKSSFRAFLLSG